MVGYSSDIDDLHCKLTQNKEAVDALELDYKYPSQRFISSLNCSASCIVHSMFRSLSGLSRLSIVPHKTFLRVVELASRSASDLVSKMPREYTLTRFGPQFFWLYYCKLSLHRVDQTSTKVRFRRVSCFTLLFVYPYVHQSFTVTHPYTVINNVCSCSTEELQKLNSEWQNLQDILQQREQEAIDQLCSQVSCMHPFHCNNTIEHLTLITGSRK